MPFEKSGERPSPKRALLAIVAVIAAWANPAAAQQTIDEPTLDPIFGKRPPPPVREVGPMNDEEYDQPQPWDPFRGFVGVLTILVPETTNLSVGVGPQYTPDYFGSDDYEFQPDPQVYVRFRNFLFFDDDGADLALFGFSGFAIGPSLRIAGRRRERDNPALVGLGDIGFTFEAGGFIATTFLDRISLRAKLRKGVAGGHEGWIADGQGTILLFTTKRFSASFSGNITWVDDNYADTFFSVTPGQAAASGLPVFDADAGFRDVGGSFNGYINIGKRWSVNPYVRYRRIFQDIADTPIIDQFGSRDQFVAGFHLMREFTFDM
ncbi:MAG: hypothetical protein GC152_13725 [Alphaproteobacteria bacterium]|nr:hypothetical protein [Alphaproteobacteria bacterium]